MEWVIRLTGGMQARLTFGNSVADNYKYLYGIIYSSLPNLMKLRLYSSIYNNIVNRQGEFELEKIFSIGILHIAIGMYFPYVKVEVLTYFYCNEFDHINRNDFMINNEEYLKIYQRTKYSATVYFVEKDKQFAVLAYFYKDSNGEWVFTGNWECVWSKNGSADDFIWPYYR